MKAIAEITYLVKIELDKEEAEWLLAYLQNFQGKNEPIDELAIRENLFNVLHNAIERQK